MHQDRPVIGVGVELDDVSITITVQQLITCKERTTERGMGFNLDIHYVSYISTD